MSYLNKLWQRFRENEIVEKIRKSIPHEVVNYLYHLPIAFLASLWYRYPAKDLIVIGVTGTSGKTTTAHLIYEILKATNLTVSLISTIKAVIGDKEYDTGFHVTNPEPFFLQKLLRQAKEASSKYVVLEMTSHGLSQFRNLGANLYIGIITNISHEHLDYHKTMKNYVLAKSKILTGVKYSILNKDDKNFRVLKNLSSGRLVSFGIKKRADFTPKTFPFSTKLFGEYNKYNCLAAVAAAKMLGVDDEVIRIALKRFSGIPGRMEELKLGQKFRIFIDFAHKPNALENVLLTAKHMAKNRVIVVFGSAGLRDRTKRPIMGEIAGRLADITVLTAEDPRTENVNTIINQIAKGAKKVGTIELRSKRKKTLIKDNHYFIRIPDRHEAIFWTIRKLAQKGDLLLFCGKGHEQSMCYGKTEYPWNEKEEIIKALDKVKK